MHLASCCRGSESKEFQMSQYEFSYCILTPVAEIPLRRRSGKSRKNAEREYGGSMYEKLEKLVFKVHLKTMRASNGENYEKNET